MTATAIAARASTVVFPIEPADLPVRQRLGRGQLHLWRRISFWPAELVRLVAALVSFDAFKPEHWGLQAKEGMAVATRPPLEIAGRDIDAELPDKRFHALLNEIQMALYQHAVNTARDEQIGRWGITGSLSQ